jgi:hypothetical protein
MWRNGGICFADHTITHRDFADRALHGIEAPVFKSPK